MGRYDPRRLAPVAELVDAADSKSVGGDIVLVRVRPGAPLRAHRLQKYSPHAARLFCSRPRPTIRRRRQAHIPRAFGFVLEQNVRATVHPFEWANSGGTSRQYVGYPTWRTTQENNNYCGTRQCGLLVAR